MIYFLDLDYKLIEELINFNILVLQFYEGICQSLRPYKESQ